jgi:hypothetical protein
MALPIARDLMNDGVRVNTILPGVFKTPMVAMMPAQVQDALGAQVPFPKRLGKAEEYANLAAFIVETPYLNAESIRLDGGVPTLGVVYQPATDTLWAGSEAGAFMESGAGRRAIRTRERGPTLDAVASKSHLTQATVDYLAEAVGECGFVSVGSSLKFCIVAQGRADIYPRLSPTSEWDTAAGHAVLLAAGGRVDGLDGGPLQYGKTAFLNRGFLATGGWEAPPIGPYMREFGGGDLPQGV